MSQEIDTDIIYLLREKRIRRARRRSYLELFFVVFLWWVVIAEFVVCYILGTMHQPIASTIVGWLAGVPTIILSFFWTCIAFSRRIDWNALFTVIDDAVKQMAKDMEGMQ